MLAAAIAVAQLCMSSPSGTLAEGEPQSEIFGFHGRGNEQKNWQESRIKASAERGVLSHSVATAKTHRVAKAGSRGTQSFTENGHAGSHQRQQSIRHLHFTGGGNEARKEMFCFLIIPFIWAQNQAQTEHPGGGKRQPRKGAQRQWLGPSGQNGVQDRNKKGKLHIREKISASCETEGGRETETGKIDIC